ncbi:hypothetical protein [Pedobacter heparinus]|uniref:hypothetical protein n=1 Tax=Pedobacter heparinus TaxID=984 RepID=UPI00292ED749|nr:hypothetical protein [Pedobacter heparinus]
MDRFKKYQSVLILLTTLLLPACKKNKAASENPAPEEKRADQLFVPVKLETTGLAITLKYKENTALLNGIEDTEGNKIALAYNNKLQLSKLEKYRNNKLYYAAYYEYKEEKLAQRVNQFEHDPTFDSFTPIGFYTLAYNDYRQFTELKYYNSNSTDNLTKACTRSYGPSQNLSAHTSTIYPNQTNLLSYNFDNKKGMASHIAESQYLALEMEYPFLLSSVNNILSYSNQQMPAENSSFTYEYSAEGYPSKMTISSNKKTQTFKITYKVLLDQR